MEQLILTIKCLLIVGFVFMVGCQTKVEVPTKVEQCIKDDATGQCTNVLIVKHIVTVELSPQMVNDCETRYKDYVEPEKSALIKQCLDDYAKYIQGIINGIQLPTNTTTGN